MGLTYVTVALRSLSGSKKLEESFLVDTGAIDCLVSAAKLAKIGLKPEGKDAYELADGTTVELPYGFARVSFMGSKTVSKVVFGPGDAESILGVVALESTGIGVDPVTRTLRRMAAKPLKAFPAFKPLDVGLPWGPVQRSHGPASRRARRRGMTVGRATGARADNLRRPDEVVAPATRSRSAPHDHRGCCYA